LPIFVFSSTGFLIKKLARHLVGADVQPVSGLSRIEDASLLVAIQIWSFLLLISACLSGWLFSWISMAGVIGVALGALFVITYTSIFARFLFSFKGALQAKQMGSVVSISGVMKLFLLISVLAVISFVNNRILICFVAGFGALQLAPLFLARPVLESYRKSEVNV